MNFFLIIKMGSENQLTNFNGFWLNMNRQGLFLMPTDQDPKYVDGVFYDYFYKTNVAFGNPPLHPSILYLIEAIDDTQLLFKYYVGTLNYIIDPHTIFNSAPSIYYEYLCNVTQISTYNYSLIFQQSPLLNLPSQCMLIFSDNFTNFYIRPNENTFPFGVPNNPPVIGFRKLSLPYNLYYPLLQQVSTFDWNNPVNLYKYWYDFIMHSFQNLSEFVQPELVKDEYDKILTKRDNFSNGINWKHYNYIAKLYSFYISGTKDPLIRKTNALRIIKSPNSKIPQTTFVLKSAPRMSYIVEVSGLTGEYSYLNGIHKTYGNVNTSSILSKHGFILNDRQYYAINIQYDSSDFPQYNPEFHGYATLKSKIFSLNNGSELIDLIIAVNDTWSQINPQTHDWLWGHARGVSAYKPNVTLPLSNTSNISYVLYAPLLTYSEVAYEPKETKLMSMLYQRNSNYYSCRSYYTNPQASSNIVSNENIFPGNLDFGIDPFYDEHWLYNIDLNNYMQGAYEVFYNPTNNTYTVAPLLQPPNGFQSLIYITNYPELYFGLIKPELTNGKIVVLIISTSWIYNITKQDFEASNPYPLVNVYGTMMTYINQTWNPETIIINQTYNFGGFYSAIFASCFGSNRYANKTLQQSNGIPSLRGAGEPLEDVQSPSRLGELHYPNNTALISPEYIQSIYPNGVFQGSESNPKNVILMTSTKAWSDGDLINYYFSGNDGDFNIGANVKVYLIGNNVGGRECGGPYTLAGIGLPKPLNTQAKIIRNNQPTSPFRFNWTSTLSTVGISAFQFSTQNSGQFLEFLKPHVLEPQDMTVFYRDVGLLKPARKYLDKIKPKYREQKTYKDSWLEEAIIIAVYGLDSLDKYRLPEWKDNIFGKLYN